MEETKAGPIKAGAANRVTTGIGLLGLGGVVAELSKLADNDPATNPAWVLVVISVAVLLLGYFGRDAHKTSEESGAE